MNAKRTVWRLACMTCLTFLAGCGGDDNGSGGGGNALAPKSIAGKTFMVQVTDGAAPFSSGGSYVFTPGGSSGSGHYRLDGTGGPQSNTGTYTYDRTGDTTANVRMVEDVSGTVVNNRLQYFSKTSGSIHSTSNRGGFQDGNFEMQ